MSFLFKDVPLTNQLQNLSNFFLPPVDVEDVAMTAVLAAEGKEGTEGILHTNDIINLPKVNAWVNE